MYAHTQALRDWSAAAKAFQRAAAAASTVWGSGSAKFLVMRLCVCMHICACIYVYACVYVCVCVLRVCVFEFNVCDKPMPIPTA